MLNRITRWQQDTVGDHCGKFLLLRDNDTGRSWSITPQPLKASFQRYNCLHGMGYTVFNTQACGIEAQWTIFVPQGMDCEIWMLKLKNVSGKKRNISLITYLELLLGVFPDWHREFHNLFVKTRFDKKNNAVLADSNLWTAPLPGDAGWNKGWPFTGVFASSAKPSSFTCDKEELFGAYNSWHDARILKEGGPLSGRVGMGFEPVVSMKFDLELAGGASKEINFMLGALRKETFSKDYPAYMKALKKPQTLLADTKAHWLELCDRFKVKTPEPAVDALINYWLKYQTISCRMLGRTAYYQCGGAFGFRDQLQDSQIYLALEPAKTKAQIKMHSAHQKKDGTVHHWWHPISEEGRFTDISDDLLWLPFVVAGYLHETADHGILKEKVPYFDGGSGTVYEHCLASIERVLKRMSPRGLTLMGEGDWNDGLNGVGVKWKGESVWLAQFFVSVLNSFAEICAKMDKGAGRAGRYRLESQKLKKALLRHAFDGKWFMLATKDSGEILGVNSCKQGKIHLNPQTWAVISGVVEGAQAKKLLAATEARLYRDYGVLLFTPAYSVVDKNIGYLTRYAPGIRENGGVYTHAATWAIWAQALAGNTQKVYETVARLCPPLLSMKDPDKYKGEPYVTPGNIEGPESIHEGKGAWTWYSGSSAWLFKCITERLLGVRVENGKLVVDPKLPAHWSGYTMERLVRGRKTRIIVKKPVGIVTEKYTIRTETL
jgi:cellobiose phosphorylase